MAIFLFAEAEKTVRVTGSLHDLKAAIEVIGRSVEGNNRRIERLLEEIRDHLQRRLASSEFEEANVKGHYVRMWSNEPRADGELVPQDRFEELRQQVLDERSPYNIFVVDRGEQGSDAAVGERTGRVEPI